MAGLTSNRCKMRVDAFILMLLIYMAFFAGDLFFRINRVIVRDHATEDLMVFRLVAVGALHVEFAAHVDIIILRREVETLIEVAVLDTIPSAAIKVALAAVLTRWRADRAGRCE